MELLLKKELADLYRKEKRRLHSFLASLTGDTDEADDLLHILFERLLSLVEKGEVRKESVRALLYTMARNLNVERLRRIQAARRYEDRYETLRSLRSSVDFSILFRNSVLKFIEKSSQLSERQREILFLRLFTSKRNGVICAELGISRRTYYRDLEVSLSQLRLALDEDGIFPGGDE